MDKLGKSVDNPQVQGPSLRGQAEKRSYGPLVAMRTFYQGFSFGGHIRWPRGFAGLLTPVSEGAIPAYRGGFAGRWVVSMKGSPVRCSDCWVIARM